MDLSPSADQAQQRTQACTVLGLVAAAVNAVLQARAARCVLAEQEMAVNRPGFAEGW
jgi:hypothetical protein